MYFVNLVFSVMQGGGPPKAQRNRKMAIFSDRFSDNMEIPSGRMFFSRKACIRCALLVSYTQ
jgi:hypothetical protein